MPPGSVRLFSFVRCFTVLDLRTYVWYGYVAFTRRIGVGNHLSAFRNRKVMALEDGRETTRLPLIFGFLTAVWYGVPPKGKVGKDILHRLSLEPKRLGRLHGCRR